MDLAIVEFQDIYDRAMGLRRFLTERSHKQIINKISYRDRDEFNEACLSLNQTLIINRENLKAIEFNQNAS